MHIRDFEAAGFAGLGNAKREGLRCQVSAGLVVMAEAGLNSTSVSDAIAEMVKRIVQRFDPDKIVLFGSHATGTAGPDSDVDLMVVMQPNGSKRGRAVEIYGLLAGMGVAKDVVVVTPEEYERYREVPGTVIRSALREGKVLYDRSA